MIETIINAVLGFFDYIMMMLGLGVDAVKDTAQDIWWFFIKTN